MAYSLTVGLSPDGVPTLRSLSAPAPQEGMSTSAPPELYKALIQQESRGDANAVSPKGAFGIGQTMPKTFAKPGFGIAGADPTKPKLAESARISKQYLDAMWQKYHGNLDYTLAAYNWGPGNTDKWIAKGADPNRLPRETQGYIANIKANYLNASGQAPGNVAGTSTQPKNVLPKTTIQPKTSSPLMNNAPKMAPQAPFDHYQHKDMQQQAGKSPFGAGFINPGKAIQSAFARQAPVNFDIPAPPVQGGLTPDQLALISRLGNLGGAYG